jgi:hypothetical protein
VDSEKRRKYIRKTSVDSEPVRFMFGFTMAQILEEMRKRK